MSVDEHQRTRILKKTSQEDFFALALMRVTRPELVSATTGACRGFRERQEILLTSLEYDSRLRTQPHEKIGRWKSGP